ncbi:MAG TPA: glycosyltransferase family 2 protein [Patescibacteria group bacterium]
MLPKVFIIILNWNGIDDTLACLESIKKLNVKDCGLGVIVVDNGSTDDSVEKLRKLVFREIDFRLVTTTTNLGFAGGNNVGIKYALESGADYVMILNNDTIVDKNLITELLKVAKKEKVGAVSPKIYFAEGFEFHKDRYKKNELGKVVWYAGGKIDWKNVYGENRGVDEVDSGQFQNISNTGFATGACMFLSSQAIREVGMFDEKYFLYLEDADLSLRLKKKGWKVKYAPKAIVWHKVSQSSGIGSNLNDYFITRNRLMFGMKYAPIRARVALIRESIKFMLVGRKWQKRGVSDFYGGKFGKGSFRNE